MRLHHKFGCLNCGKRRKKADIINMTYDVYLRDDVSGSLMRVGLCSTCFESKDELGLDDLKEKLAVSEVAILKSKGRNEEHADVFKQARIIGRMGYRDYWKEADKKMPKRASEFVGIVKDERHRDN